MEDTRELTPAEQVAALYARAEIDLKRALELWASDRDAAVRNARHAQAIFDALLQSLHGKDELAINLRSVYINMRDKCELACTLQLERDSTDWLTEARNILVDLSKAWEAVIEKNK